MFPANSHRLHLSRGRCFPLHTEDLSIKAHFLCSCKGISHPGGVGEGLLESKVPNSPRLHGIFGSNGPVLLGLVRSQAPSRAGVGLSGGLHVPGALFALAHITRGQQPTSSAKEQRRRQPRGFVSSCLAGLKSLLRPAPAGLCPPSSLHRDGGGRGGASAGAH